MTLKYLVTGVTGGLGASVLSYLVANVPSSEYAAASSSEANRKRFEDRGIAFRVVNYDDPQSLETAFHDVENLFFVSTNTFDVQKREIQHQNFVDAAKKQNVQHVCILSAFSLFKSSPLMSRRFGIPRLLLVGSARILKPMSNRPIY